MPAHYIRIEHGADFELQSAHYLSPAAPLLVCRRAAQVPDAYTVRAVLIREQPEVLQPRRGRPLSDLGGLCVQSMTTACAVNRSKQYDTYGELRAKTTIDGVTSNRSYKPSYQSRLQWVQSVGRRTGTLDLFPKNLTDNVRRRAYSH